MKNNSLQANSLIAETAIKQVAQYTKVVSHVFDSVSKAREEWEVESSTRSGTDSLKRNQSSNNYIFVQIFKRYSANK